MTNKNNQSIPKTLSTQPKALWANETAF